MKQLTYDFVKSIYEKHGYPFPVSKDKVILKITGIRTNNQLASVFNDYLVYCWEELNIPQFFGCMGTTHPGAFYLENPMNRAGAAVVIPGYYKNVWKIGYHGDPKKKHRALTQDGDFDIWRDDDKNNLLPTMEFKGGKWLARDSNSKLLVAQKSGLAGINHHGTRIDVKKGLPIGRWSAGCQVIENWAMKEKVMDLAKKHAADNDSAFFSYALTVEDDYN